MMLRNKSNPNLLIHEKSPYLLQHAYNPVRWFPWGEEAFREAREKGKPVFLSIGYSTCHWCHVMEEESFEDERIAKILNDQYVSIKVDREERPDIDQVYMEAVMAMTGSGGWPLNVFLTPDKKPFFGGTYFPPDDRYGRPGFETVLLQLAYQWSKEREKVLDAGESLVKALADFTAEKRGDRRALTEETLEKGFKDLEARYDAVHGGFGGAPKFPASHTLSFLIYYAVRSRNREAMEMAVKTLDQMARGGIYDHLGGGFHRYSTDERWHVPHFEKMLYDQALLARTYVEAYQALGFPRYEKTAREIFGYVLRGMTHKEGGFFSAEDADSAVSGSSDSQKREGAFYVWPAAAISGILNPEESGIFKEYYGIEETGNVRHDPFGEFKGQNVLYLAKGGPEAITDQLLPKLEAARKKMLKEREKRPRPHLDDKILTDWNGLMIAAFAGGAAAFQDERLAGHAARAADFVLKNLSAGNGRLLHRWREGKADIPGFLDDYAFFTLGLFELYQATFETRYLSAAKEYADTMLDLFEDKEEGGFFFSSPENESLFANPKPAYDGAIPSGNSAAALVLARLGRLLMEKRYEDASRRALSALSFEIGSRPSVYPFSLLALDFHVGPVQEIVLYGKKDDPLISGAVKHIFKEPPLRRVLVHFEDSTASEEAARLIPYLAKQASGKSPAVYVCENYACKLPVHKPEDLAKALSTESVQ